MRNHHNAKIFEFFSMLIHVLSKNHAHHQSLILMTNEPQSNSVPSGGRNA